MPRVIYVEHSGVRHEVEVPSGTSVMQGAIDNLIEGIVGDCGGSCCCATCHCYVADAWVGLTGEADDNEKAMLDCVFDPQDNSRLSCQIVISAEHDGLIIQLPESQN